MVKVMASGVFDLLHTGHLHYLQEAKKMGDELIVVVATDKTVRQCKYTPVTPQNMRRELVASLKPVDRAVIGTDDDPLDIVEEIQPDIIALGHDQSFPGLQEKLSQRGLKANVVQCSKYSGHDLNGTRKIIRKIYKNRINDAAVEK